MGTFYKPTPHCVKPELLGTTERQAWVRFALQYLRARRPRVFKTPGFAGFTAEDIAIEMQVHQYPPPPGGDTRLWGLVMQTAKREGFIADTGEKRMTRAGHKTPVWAYAVAVHYEG